MAMVHNHPKTGDKIKVEPLKSVEDVNRVKVLLRNNIRDLALFTLGVNSALRPSELLQIRVGMVRTLRPGDSFEINGKSVTVNKPIAETIVKLLVAMSSSSECDYLFQSKKHTGQPLEVSSLHRMVKTWCGDICLTGNFGSHSLRKSYGYISRMGFNTDVAELSKMFNHTDKRQTIEYLCLPPEEMNNVRIQEI